MTSEQLAQVVRDRLGRAGGCLTFAEFMELVLYHPECGYYSSGTVRIGADGDFFTSPSLGPDFGELLAVQLAELWEFLDRPSPFALVEIGAGQGVLAGDILSWLKESRKACFAALDYRIVEYAPALIARQQQELTAWGDRVRWQAWDEIPDGSLIGCCFSNELVDALPVHRVAIADGKIQEVYVTLDAGDRLTEKVAELSTPKLREYFDEVGINLSDPAYPDGYRTEVNLSAIAWLETVACKLDRGYAITVDYGYSAQKLYRPQRSDGTLQCYFQHRRHSNPYVNLGRQDITAHVDFTALDCFGRSFGLITVGATQQGLFLMALGLGDRLMELSSGKFDVAHVLQRRDALHQLINPSGLGGFQVLVQGKKVDPARSLRGLTVPPLM
ncbi:hypothetical protein KR51_00008970 [Rubidibacter lacunae KORDI 51-2]|uniref:Class I SAM-dependent methyltransferase n=1 Tax=Rubidibacter lacunae KORDI 51-2 TaxID=582515 RepID=U5DL16_9CHRO|nr:class I SAM-dependent methyltransferase [Rubidibacter lacunae]ERN42376.1 hypothetical protein KR51_00008970 [Rubidibacter lacunae KORDI 51-2]